MRKLIKTTALFTLLLLFSGTSFAGGWQKSLSNYGLIAGEADYFPTKDGGTLLSYYSGFTDNNNNIVKFDKFGNISWKKTFLKYTVINTDSFRITTQFVGKKIFDIIEIPNERFAIFHSAPTIDTFFYANSATHSAYFKTFKGITIIDKFGNVINTKYNNSDSIEHVMDLSSKSVLYFDSLNKNYKNVSIYTTTALINTNQHRYSYLQTKLYDSAFNFIDISIKLIDSIVVASGTTYYNHEYYMEKHDSLLLISDIGFGRSLYFSTSNPQRERLNIKVTDLNGNFLYKDVSLNIFNDLTDSLQALYPNCSIRNPRDYGENSSFSDYYFDINGHFHLYGLVEVTSEGITTGDSCYKIHLVLVHVELDKQGNKIKQVFNNLSSKYNMINYHPFVSTPFYGYNLMVYPKKNGTCNIFIYKFLFGIDEYHFLNFDFNNNKVLSYKKIKNYGDLNHNSIAFHDFQYFAGKKKSLIDDSYICALASPASTGYGLEGIFKIDTNGNINTHAIIGNVFADQNGNCIKNVTDKNLPQVTVKAVRDNNNTAYTSSDNNGNYSIGVGDSGLYTVTAQPNINYPLFAQSSCAVQTSYAYLDSFTIDTINLNLKPTILCPNMYVDISTPMLRRCFSNIYTVNYKNNGTIASPNTFIDVALDRFLTINSASIPYTNLGNNVLRFNVGNVDYMSSGRFTIDVTVRCDSTIVGQTHCVEAHIYPDTVCAVASYTGPVISTTAICKHDSVEFKIRNSGGDMSQRKRYIVIEDNVNRLNGTFQLNTGQQQLVTIAADTGRTYGIIAEQDALFPSQLGDAYASAFIEGCNPVSGTFTTGIITQYPEFDGEPYRSVDCQQNRGSFDPNDKTGYPIGVSGNHNIEKNTAIDYKINFQNTGNDTAFKVVIIDTISKYLDINTIEPGASSHRYTYMRTDSNTIKFIFDSIKLVDSNKNEKLSHGFVKFRIQQKANNPNGTKIYNTAEIYFDYNSPIFTNKTMHTIGDVYVRIISKVISPSYAKADIKIYPNPFRDKTTIELQNIEVQKTSLVLIDITGKEILQQSSINNQYEINGGDLAKGFYLFQIKNDKGEIANGKLIVQ